MLRFEVIFVAGCQVLAHVMELPYANVKASSLAKPRLSVPLDDQGESNPTRNHLQGVIVDYEADFVDGWCNHHQTVMHFHGDAHRLNSMLKDLSDVEGAVITVRFSRENHDAPTGILRASASLPCQWSIHHNGWNHANRLSLTVFLGDGTIKREDVIVPKKHDPVDQEPQPVELRRIWLQTLPVTE